MINRFRNLVFLIFIFSVSLYAENTAYLRYKYDSLVDAAGENIRYKLEEAKQNVEEALDIAKNNNFKLSVMHIFNLGRIYRNYGEHDKALSYLFQALDSFLISDDYFHIAEVCYTIGWTYMSKQDFPKAYENYQKSYNIADQYAIGEFLVKSTFAFGTLEGRSGETNKELEHYLRCIELSFKYNYLERLDHIYYWIANHYAFQDSAEKTIKIINWHCWHFCTKNKTRNTIYN